MRVHPSIREARGSTKGNSRNKNDQLFPTIFVFVFVPTVGVILRQSLRPSMSSITGRFRGLRDHTNSTTLRFSTEAIYEGLQNRLPRVRIG